jgi:predicted ATPase
MPVSVTRLKAKDFRSLGDVDVPLGQFTVLVGPNGSGKSNLLNVLRFLATTVRFDLAAAVHQWGGIERVLRQSTTSPRQVELGVEGTVTKHARSTSPDRYTLSFSEHQGRLQRSETFEFKRYRGAGRKITVQGRRVEISGDRRSSSHLADTQATGLATRPKLGDDEGGEGIRTFAAFLASMRVLEPDARAARAPSRLTGAHLADDASNLADALLTLKQEDPVAFSTLETDLQNCLPGLDELRLAPVTGSTSGIVVQLVERGIRRPIDLADASFGTVRALAILCALHEPAPPGFTAIEEIDHGLHPYALEVLIDRLRAASERTQILVTTHSPTFVNRLQPGELVVCSRDTKSGASVIPALNTQELEAVDNATDLRLGELWFAGAIEGVPTLDVA